MVAKGALVAPAAEALDGVADLVAGVDAAAVYEAAVVDQCGTGPAQEQFLLLWGHVLGLDIAQMRGGHYAGSAVSAREFGQCDQALRAHVGEDIVWAEQILHASDKPGQLDYIAEDLGPCCQVVGALATGLVVGDAIFSIGSVEGGDGLRDLIASEQIARERVALFVELPEVSFHLVLWVAPVPANGIVHNCGFTPPAAF